ncbi:MAG: YraN family protein [Bryobacteraceae bacterium]
MHWLFRLLDDVRHRARRGRWHADLAAGRRGEDLAHRFLERRGMTVVARNYKTPSGGAEVDLIAWDGGDLVFIEVKSRATEEHGAPDRAIGDAKRRKIIYAALDYVRRTGLEHPSVRFDVVNVVFERPDGIAHFRDAFAPAGAGFAFRGAAAPAGDAGRDPRHRTI